MNVLRFHQSEMTAILEGDARACRFEARLPVPSLGDRARLEVLWQPRDKLGLPLGPPFVMFEGTVPVIHVPGQSCGQARWRIPLKYAAASDCHFRISPDTDGTADDV